MNTYEFNLVLAGVAELTPELADSLYDAISGDIELNMSDGIAYLECTRQAGTLREAVMATIVEVEAAGSGVRVIRVESEAANTIARINADLLQTTGRV